MKQTNRALFLTALISALAVPALHAGTDTKEVTPAPVVEEDNTPISQEFNSSVSYTGRSTTKQGSASIGSVGNINNHISYVVSPQIKDGYLLRIGGDWERNSFSLPSAAPLPNTLQSANLILGLDMAVSDKIIMRAEIHPGVYSDWDDVTTNDIDAPVQLGGTYLYSKDLQFIFGVQIDLKSSIPIIGIPGIRWQFADNWVLSAIPPKPQVQYQVNNALTLYVGAELLGGTYQLNDKFGSSHGHGPTTGANNQKFDDNVVDFAEIRVGAGLTWKFTPNLSLDVSGGYMPYRTFEIHENEIGFDPDTTSFHNNVSDGAPYAEVGISGSF